jgi:hypothetical protein
MLLTLVTILVATYVKRPFLIVMSVFILHVFYAWISSFGINGVDKDVGASAIISLLIGVVLHKWLERKKQNHDPAFMLLLKRQITGSAALILLALSVVCVWNVFLAIENAQLLILKAKAQIAIHGAAEIAHTETIITDTQETTGFGIISDIETINPISGELTAQAKRAKEKEFARQRENGEWNLLDAALIANNTLYMAASGLVIEYGYKDDPDFKIKNVPGIFDNIPSRFHPTISRSGSAEGAYTKRASIEEYLKNEERLAYSGFEGKMAVYIVKLVDF